MMMIMGWN